MRVMVIALALVAAAAIGCEEPVPCATAEDCADTEVCTADGCAAALGVEYALTSASAVGISAIGPPPDYGMWDPGEPPDPYLVLTAGDWTCQTFHDTDTYSPDWSEVPSCDSLVVDGSTLFGWSLWDHDGIDDPQLIAEIAAGGEFGATAQDLHLGTVSSVVGDVTVELDFAPSSAPSGD